MTTALYTQIIDRLSEKRQTLAAPLRLPVEEEMAVEHRVARDTIRRALKQLEEQGAVVRRRGRGTFLQPLRVPLTTLKGTSVGFVPPWWADSTSASFTSTVFEGVSRWADSEQCHLAVLHAADRQMKDYDAWLQRVKEQRLAGLIWVHPQRWQMPLIERSAKYLPSVILGRHYPDSGLHHVMPDYARAAQLMDQRLVSRGHKAYAVVIVDHLEAFSQNWITAFESAHEVRGEQFDTRNYLVDIKAFDRNDLPRLLLDFYQPHNPDVQAFVLPTSTLLVNLLRDERFRRGVEDKQISLVTMDFGMYPMDAYWLGHTVDHVTCDWTRIGRRAMESLALLAAGHEVPEVIREPVGFTSGDTVHVWTPPTRARTEPGTSAV